MSEQEELQENLSEQPVKDEGHHILPLRGMYENWFLDYASYVILERAVPELYDGLKPVQRRILHAMNRLDDGRFNKVANIIGHTMQFHPHGDASIGDALVQLGQKDLLVDCQGNWGNTLTGDSAAAPRYIEARLSKFARDVVFNPKTTDWKASYDGRNKEPITLPVKFPLLLAQGVEGIAVGLASKIMPHNFNELIDASIKILKDEDFIIYPDFLTGGLIDVSRYNEGIRGSRIRVRARITQLDKKTLIITEIPFSTTTISLIESIISANDKGKIKIRKIDDNTAEKVEIVIHLAPGVSPDQTIDALYAFTSCEVSISPNSCVIFEEKPQFLSVSDILRQNTKHTVFLLKRELEIRLEELEDQWHNFSLEKVFIENRIYQLIEDCETWESVLETIDKGLTPFKSLLRREVVEEDLLRLTEIKIKRISKFNSFKADEQIKSIEDEMLEVKNHLLHLVDYAINYFRQIKKKYGSDKDRKTEIRNFDNIEAAEVAVANQRLYVNREEGFAGTSLKKDEFVTECSDIDDIIVFRENGTFIVTKVSAKFFIGQNIIHIDVFKKNDDRTIYNLIYRDGKKGVNYVKRFAVRGITRDKEYDLTIGTDDSKILYLSANPNGEAEIVKVYLRPKPKMKKTHFDFNFGTLAIKGRNVRGNTLTKNAIKNILKSEEGISTLSAIDIYFDDTVRRLNTDGRGEYIGAFESDDKILTLLKTGEFKLTGYDLQTHFDDDMIHLSKYFPETIITAVYWDGEVQKHFVKRFAIEEGSVINKKYLFVSEGKGSELISYSLDFFPRIELEIQTKSGNEIEFEVVPINEFIGVKSFKAKGKRLSYKELLKFRFIEPMPYEPADLETEINETDQEFDSESIPEENAEPSIIEENEPEKGERTSENEIHKPSKEGPQMELEF